METCIGNVRKYVFPKTRINKRTVAGKLRCPLPISRKSLGRGPGEELSEERSLPRRFLPLKGCAYEYQGANGHGAELGQVPRVPHVQHSVQERVDHGPRHGIHVVQQRGNQARRGLSQRMGKSGPLQGRLGNQGRQAPSAGGRQDRQVGKYFCEPGSAGPRRLL